MSKATLLGWPSILCTSSAQTRGTGSFPSPVPSLSSAEATLRSAALSSRTRHPETPLFLLTPTYPLRGLPPLLFRGDKGFAADCPAPKHLVVVHGDVWFLGEIPNHGHGHGVVTVYGGIRKPEVGRGGGCRRVWNAGERQSNSNTEVTAEPVSSDG